MKEIINELYIDNFLNELSENNEFKKNRSANSLINLNKITDENDLEVLILLRNFISNHLIDLFKNAWRLDLENYLFANNVFKTINFPFEELNKEFDLETNFIISSVLYEGMFRYCFHPKLSIDLCYLAQNIFNLKQKIKNGNIQNENLENKINNFYINILNQENISDEIIREKISFCFIKEEIEKLNSKSITYSTEIFNKILIRKDFSILDTCIVLDLIERYCIDCNICNLNSLMVILNCKYHIFTKLLITKDTFSKNSEKISITILLPELESLANKENLIYENKKYIELGKLQKCLFLTRLLEKHFIPNLYDKTLEIKNYLNKEINCDEKKSSITKQNKEEFYLNNINKITDLKIKDYLINRFSDGEIVFNADGTTASKEVIYFKRVFSLPFNKLSEPELNLQNISNILNETHFGMKDVKQKILEILAVYNRKQDSPPPIICLVGSPGVGKSSLVYSISKSINREIYKINISSLQNPESLIGAASFYAASKNGRISEALINTKVMNPLILLDEIDKSIKIHNKGNVEDSLLNILDPSQNHEFYDDYFDFNIDLSKCMFICTANDISKISAPLLDRMQIININGYSKDDKIKIAEKYIIPNLIQKNGIVDSDNFKLNRKTISYIVDNYTNEDGIRNLESILDSIIKLAIYEKDVNQKILNLSIKSIDKIICKRKVSKENNLENQIGYINGLYASSIGGGILKIESILINGEGNIKELGSLGKMTTNSIQLIHNLLKSRYKEWNIPLNIFTDKDICINLGFRDVDGPSAGVAIVASIISSIKQIKISNLVGMTGELNLNGFVLPIGGCHQKLIGAKSEGITKLFFPKGNKDDFLLIKDEDKKGIDIVFVDHIDEILQETGLI